MPLYATDRFVKDNKSRDHCWGPEKLHIIKLIKTHPGISTRDLATLLNLQPELIETILKALEKDNIVHADFFGRLTYTKPQTFILSN